MSETMTKVDAQSLSALTSAVFKKRGMNREDAERVADVLVWADAGGHPSHGVARIPRYLEFIDRGDLDPTASPGLAFETGAVARLDCNRCAGAVALAKAGEIADQMAAASGIGLCLASETTHIGAAGYFAEKLGHRGKIGIVLAASGPLMAYQGTAAAAVSTAPLAICVPAGSKAPLLLDMACSIAALGKIRQLAAADSPIPAGWALNSSGQPTTDAREAKIQMPLGGAKGSGLALMFECIASLLAGVPLLVPALIGGSRKRHSQNAAVIALDIEAFIPAQTFADQAAELVDAISQLPKIGESDILMPGERSQALRRHTMKDGIPIRKSLWDKLQALPR